MKAWWVILIIVAVAALSATLPDLMLSPGALTQGHQDLKNRCTDCHRPFGGIETVRCTRCHVLAEGGADTGWTSADVLRFHRQLKEQECLSCHTDHRGKDPGLATTAFDHALLPAAMQTSCESCHARPADTLHHQLAVSVSCHSCHHTETWALQGRFDHDLITGTSKTACASCHPAPGDAFHQSLKEECSACHGTAQWVPSTFDHARYFVLDRDHNVKCITCHTSNNYKAYTCYGCHEHSERGIRGEHEEHGIFNFTDCASCHRSADEHDIRMPGGDQQKQREADAAREHLKPGNREESDEEHN